MNIKNKNGFEQEASNGGNPNFNLWFVLKKGWNSFARHKLHNIPLILIIGFSIGFGVTLIDAQDSALVVQDDMIARTNFPDGLIYTELTPKSTIDGAMQAKQDELFAEFESRLVLPVEFTFDFSKEPIDGLVVLIDDSRALHLNQLIDVEGNRLEKENGTINFGFTVDYPEVQVGVKLNIAIGLYSRSFEIQQIGFSYEFQYSSLSEDNTFPSLNSYPIFYLDYNELSDMFMGIEYCNQVFYKLETGITQNQAKDYINGEFGGQILKIYEKENYPAIEFTIEDAETDGEMMRTIVWLFLLGAAFVMVIVLSRRIDEDMKQVGVFNALGATRKEIVSSYFVYVGIILGLGLLFASVIGYYFKGYVRTMYTTLMKVPVVPELPIVSQAILQYGIGFLVMSLLITWYIIRKNFSMDPARQIHREEKYLKKENFMEKFYRKIGAKLRPFKKYSIRRTFNQKIYGIFTVVSLVISILLMMLSFQLWAMIDVSVEKKYQEVEKWDGYGEFWNYQNETFAAENLTAYSEIEVLEFGIWDILEYSVGMPEENGGAYQNEKNAEYLILQSYQQESKLHNYPIDEGQMMNAANEGMVTTDLFNTLGIEIGDEIWVRSLKIVAAQFLKIKIVATVNDLTSNALFLQMSMAQAILNKSGMVNMYYYTAAEGVNIPEFNDHLLTLPFIKSAHSKDDLMGQITQMMDDFNFMLPLIAAIMVGFAFLVVFTITRSVVGYRTQDYGNLMAIGLYYRDIRNSVIKEMLLYSVAAVLLSLIIAPFFLNYYVEYFKTIMSGMYAVQDYQSVGMVIGLALGTTVVGTLEPLQSVKRLDLAKVVREKNFG